MTQISEMQLESRSLSRRVVCLSLNMLLALSVAATMCSPTPAPVAATDDPQSGAPVPPEIALHVAAEEGDLDKVKELVASGADVNAKVDKEYEGFETYNVGMPPLHASCMADTTSTMQFLLDSGVDIHAMDAYGKTALHFTANTQLFSPILFEKIDLLLAHRADINEKRGRNEWVRQSAGTSWTENLPEFQPQQRDDGATVLHVVVDACTPELLSEFIKRGADVNAKSDIGMTPMFIASVYQRTEIVEKLIEAGARVSETSVSGVTPLHLASVPHQTNLNCDPRLIRLLIEHGADVLAKDVRGETPLDYAKKWGDEKAVEMLEDAMREVAN